MKNNPSYNPDFCCGAHCYAIDDESEPCWGNVSVYDEVYDEVNDDYDFVHECEGHNGCYDKGAEYEVEVLNDQQLERMKHLNLLSLHFSGLFAVNLAKQYEALEKQLHRANLEMAQLYQAFQLYEAVHEPSKLLVVEFKKISDVKDLAPFKLKPTVVKPTVVKPYFRQNEKW